MTKEFEWNLEFFCFSHWEESLNIQVGFKIKLKDLNYGETLSHVIKPTTIYVVLNLALSLNYDSLGKLMSIMHFLMVV